MRIPSASTDRYIYFVAVDVTDLKTRETGLTGFTVYRSRNGGVAAAMTTPTVNETDTTNMPGVYELLLDEDTTLTAGNDTEEFCLHITHASMAPVTRVVELYRPETTEGNTLDVTATGAGGLDWGNIENPTTAQNLSGTNIDVDQVVASVSGAVGSVTGAVGSVTAAVTIDAGSVDAIWDELQSGHVTAGSFGRYLDAQVANVETDTQDIQSRLPAALVSGRIDASVGAMAANVVTAAAINTAAITAAKFGAGAVDAAALATDAVNEIRDAILPTQNATFNNIMFLFVAASDHVTPVTGATGTAVTRSIDGGAFGSGTGSLAEIGNGIYQYDASAADMNGGIITFRFTATGGTPGAPDDRFLTIVTGGGV